MIRETKRKDFVSMWNLIYHERLAVNNLGRMLNGSDLNDEDDNRVNHKFTKAEIDRQERNISNMIKFMMTIQNPAYVSVNTESRLYNIITQEIVPDEISTDLLNVFEMGDLLYADFRQKRYIDKNVPLSDNS